MNSIKYLLLIFLINPAYSQDATQLSKDIMAIILPTNNKESIIKTSGCQYQKAKWGKLLLTKQSFEETFSFSKTCDLQGTFTPAIDKFFPLNLKIKGHKNITEALLQVKFSIAFEDMPVLNVVLNESNLKKKNNQNNLFKLEYGHYLDLLSKNPLARPKGGNFTVLKMGKKIINKTVKI
jgi:hypothetical protein